MIVIGYAATLAACPRINVPRAHGDNLPATCFCCGDVAYPTNTDMALPVTECLDDEMRGQGVPLSTCEQHIKIVVKGATNVGGVPSFVCFRGADGGAVP